MTQPTPAKDRSPEFGARPLIAALSDHPLVIGLLLAAHAAMLLHGALVHSPTWDEIGHLPSGISHWETGRFELYRVNPPLVRMVAALPVLAMQPRLDWESYDDRPQSRAEFKVGRDFLAANGERSFAFFSAARCACIPLSLIGALVCWRWARELGGPISGVVALALWCFCPNLIAHGHLITPDSGATALGLAAMYSVRRWSQSGTWRSAWLAGLILGLAELTKTTLLLLYPVLVILALFPASPSQGDHSPSPTARTRLLQTIWIVVLSIYVINLAYGFEGSLRRLGDQPFVSALAKRAVGKPGEPPPTATAGLLCKLPMPLPANYVLGIDVQRRDFEQKTFSYLRGEWSYDGWWYYYLYGCAVKLPCGTLLLILAGMTRLVIAPIFSSRREAARELVALLLPPVLILAVVSSQTGINQHWRYALPALSYLFILGSLVVAKGRGSSPVHSAMARRVAVTLCGAALLWTVVSCVRCLPHSLTYFNEVAGGPDQGHRHMLGSSFDWGQDLLFVKSWHKDHPEAQLLYVWYPQEIVDPRVLGIDCQAVEPANARKLSPRDVPAGWYVVRIKDQLNPHNELPSLRGQTPVAKIGYTTLVFHLSAEKKQ